MDFQQLILALTQYWADYGCVIVQPYNSEVGAGTLLRICFLRKGFGGSCE